ncbi:hypothetical protein [Algoriphagus sp.]|uniref:hypothetical protein n=1 Tax=Algoriphagus sp. TaxID=1872435 RepID=UPI00391B3004
MNQEYLKIEGMNLLSLFFKRQKTRLNAKIKVALANRNQQKANLKREEILKIRQEKLKKFRINYIPLCSDEDWEAMSEFYSKNSKK